jgi:hypothetical protein
MHSTLTTLLDRLDSIAIEGTDVISWGAPVLAFGDPATARVATLGLNPSNREFVDELGSELRGIDRRFHTLSSLGLSSWSEAEARHLRLILDTCREYFLGNPYDRWFKRLDQIISGLSVSYYGKASDACHLDLIPFATSRKWTELTPQQRLSLSGVAADALALLLRDSAIEVLVLNGRSVVNQFQTMAGVSLICREMPTWSLRRGAKSDVKGLAFSGIADSVSGIALHRKILVLGFNHNLQSSYGVTTDVVNAIRDWVSQMVFEAA